MRYGLSGKHVFRLRARQGGGRGKGKGKGKEHMCASYDLQVASAWLLRFFMEIAQLATGFTYGDQN